MESSGDLVAVLVELTSRMEVRETHLESGLALLMVDLGGDTPSVVCDGDGSVLVDCDVHLCGEAGHDLVNTVVHNLVYHMMESAGIRRSDVHTGSFPDGFEALQRDDAVCVVLLFGLLHVPIHLNRTLMPP